MKRIIALVLFLVLSLAAETISQSLNEFAAVVAAQHRINIIVDDSISDKHLSLYYDRDKPPMMLEAFRNVLQSYGLSLTFNKSGNFYYIADSNFYRDELYSISLDSISYDDIKASLTLANVKHTYIPVTNTIVLFTGYADYLSILELVRAADVVPDQFQLKMTIVETNLNEIKERGVNLQSYISDLSGASQSFYQLLTMPFTSSITTFNDASSGIYAVLRFLNENGYTDLKSSPYMTVQSGKTIYFSSVQNIPYKTASTSVNGASQSQSETIEYQDIGLKISLTPKIVKDIVFCSMKFSVENLLDKGSLTPSTSKRELNNDFQLRRGQVLVLSGINQTEKQTTHYGIPLLNDIPYLGGIFGFDHTEQIDRVLTVTIEVL